jgi:hypothetical protein
MNRRYVVSVLLSFVAGVAAAILAPRLIRPATDRVLFPEHRTEALRVTSPDGAVDAVAERVNCGAPCSSGYAVSVVSRGAAAPKDPEQQVFLADDVANAQIQWKEPHLLDIAYDKAFIHSFRNVAYPLGRPGNVESWHYAVEIHLSPSSARFSYLSYGNGNRTSE